MTLKNLSIFDSIALDYFINYKNETYFDDNITSAKEAQTQLPPTIHRSTSVDWGPKRDPLYIVVPITILYIIIFLTGVAGNVSTCIVIFRNKTMHTATNYYLFSLAVSDLLLLISGLPPEIYFVWSKYPYIFGEAFCVLQGFAAETSANATVLTITAFTIERYVAICHPFLSHTMSKLSRAIKFIIVIWILAMCFATPQAMAFGIYYEREKDGSVVNEHYVCIVMRTVIPHAFEISTFLFFVAPMTLISILYILIGLQLHRSTAGGTRGGSVKLKHRIHKPIVTYTNSSKQTVLLMNGMKNGRLPLSNQEEDGRKNYSRNAQATKHVVKMLVAVVVAFFICWAPFHAQRLLAIYGAPTSTHMITAFGVMTYISGILYYVSTTINPLLYHIISNKFREAFKETFRQCFKHGRGTPGGRCYSTLSGRSSQVNSHSNTDSCSRQSSLRYLEAEMARLHESRRPLVVSFRRKKPQYQQKQVTIFDKDVQDTVHGLNDECGQRKEVFRIKDDGSGLQPTHICPLNDAFPLLVQMEKRGGGRQDRDIHSSQKPNGLTTPIKEVTITKSSTMPQMGNNNSTVNRQTLMETYGSKPDWSSLSEKNVTFNNPPNMRHLNEKANSLTSMKNFKNQPQYLYVV